jgi:ankyrin repeat protein
LGLRADYNYGRGFTRSPLHGAIMWSTPENEMQRINIMMLLLEAGADPDVGDSEGCTPIFDAIERDLCAALRLLIAWGADTNSIDGTGRSALEVALDMGRWEIVEMLRQNELNVVLQ